MKEISVNMPDGLIFLNIQEKTIWVSSVRSLENGSPLMNDKWYKLEGNGNYYETEKWFRWWEQNHYLMVTPWMEG